MRRIFTVFDFILIIFFARNHLSQTMVSPSWASNFKSYQCVSLIFTFIWEETYFTSFFNMFFGLFHVCVGFLENFVLFFAFGLSPWMAIWLVITSLDHTLFSENTIQVAPFPGICYALLGVNLLFIISSYTQWGCLIFVFRSFQLQKIVSNYTLDDCFLSIALLIFRNI